MNVHDTQNHTGIHVSKRFLRCNSSIEPLVLEKSLEKLYNDVWNEFVGHVAAICAQAKWQPRATIISKRRSNPRELLGMVVGGFQGNDSNIFLSFQSEEIQNLIRSIELGDMLN